MALSQRGLIQLARKNQLSPLLRYNWEKKTGFDPVVAAYEEVLWKGVIGALLFSIGGMLLLGIMHAAFPEIPPTAFDMYGFLIIGCVFIGGLAVAISKDRKRWINPRSLTLEFPARLEQLAKEMRTSDVAWLKDYDLLGAVRTRLVERARVVLEEERYRDGAALDMKAVIEQRLLDSRKSFERLYDLSAQFGLASGGYKPYYDEAAKLFPQRGIHVTA